MKRYLIHYIILLFTLSACNSSLVEIPVPEETPITFGIGVPGITAEGKSRAVIETTAELSGKDIAIFGTRYSTGNNADWSTGERINNMNPATVTIDDTTPIVGTDFYSINYITPQAYYSLTDLHDFRMIYPMNAAEGVTINNNAMTAEIDLAKQPDLLYAKFNGVIKRFDAVPFTLEHQLASIEFYIKKNINLDYSIYLNHFRLKGSQKAKYDLVLGTLSDFSNPADEFQVGKIDHHDFEITTSNQLACKSLIFPTENLSSYTFKVTISQKEYDIRIPEELTPPGGSTPVPYAKWEAGKKYTYNLVVTDANVHVEFVGFTEQDWESVPETIPII